MTFTADTGQVAALAGGLAGAADQLRDPAALLGLAGAEVARLAGPRTPTRTGRLAGSLLVVVDSGAARVQWGVGYAVPVNFGTVRMAAQPFATDALTNAQPALEAATLGWADEILESVG